MHALLRVLDEPRFTEPRLFCLLASDAPPLCILLPPSSTPSIVFLPLTNALLHSPLLPLATGDMPSSLTDEGTPQALQTINRPDEGPQVNSIRDLHSLCSISDSETGAFKRSVFTFIGDQDYVYFGGAPIGGMYLSSQDLKKALKRVPDEDVYPEAPSQITVASIPTEVDVYVKRPKLNIYDNWVNSGLLARLFLGEAETFEALIRKPHHRNIIRYHGCIVHRRRITGIVLDRCSKTLEDRLREGAHGFNKRLCMDGIKSGVEHLHSLGYAHNDLNPSNIMVSEDDTPIIIDLGSCKRFGKALISGGTCGWIDEDFTTSERRHDEAALTKLWEWLEKK